MKQHNDLAVECWHPVQKKGRVLFLVKTEHRVHIVALAGEWLANSLYLLTFLSGRQHMPWIKKRLHNISPRKATPEQLKYFNCC